MSRWTLSLTPVLLWTVTSCSGTDAPSVSVTVRDSSGVRIVETTATSPFAAPWQIADSAGWSVGEVEGDPDYLLNRVAGAMKLPDERILVANGGTNEIRAYDREGRLVQTFGREGEGPGEFQYLRAIGRCQDEGVTAFDINWQVSRFTSDGRFLGREVLTTPEGITPYNLTCDPQGRVLILGWGRGLSAGPQLGFHALRDRLLLTTLDGGSQTDLGTWLVSERIGSPTGSRPHPAGKATVFDLHDDHVFVGSGEQFEVEVRRLDGTLQTLLRGPRLALQVTDSLKARTLEVMLRGVDAARQPNVRSSVLEWDWPESIPAFTALQVDSEGVVWTRAYSADFLAGEVWSLLDQEEGYLGDLQLPPGQTLLEVGNDYLLVLSKDELEVERVQRYALTRSES
ncbi:MAG: hypothetical protein WD942_03215 [Dehalococcoidia bacterium]